MEYTVLSGKWLADDLLKLKYIVRNGVYSQWKGKHYHLPVHTFIQITYVHTIVYTYILYIHVLCIVTGILKYILIKTYTKITLYSLLFYIVYTTILSNTEIAVCISCL